MAEFDEGSSSGNEGAGERGEAVEVAAGNDDCSERGGDEEGTEGPEGAQPGLKPPEELFREVGEPEFLKTQQRRPTEEAAEAVGERREREKEPPKSATVRAAPVKYNNAPAPSAEGEQEGGRGGNRGTGQGKRRDMEDFLAKGEGGAMLPRKRQDKREREKQKRQKGQHGREDAFRWKSEQEMALRQQVDK